VDRPGSIPVLVARGKSLAEAWERSVVALWEGGCDIRTEYDAKDDDGNYVDPPSKDSTMMIVVEDPSSEPFYHKAFPGGLEDLQEYSMEVCEGIKDHWMNQPDPTGTKWKYTYHDRIFRYTVDHMNGWIDQYVGAIKKLAKSPHSRRVQMVTWKVWEDIFIDDPACLQSIWCRVLPDADGIWWLNMNVRFRSRDAYDAAFMNCVGFIKFMEMFARDLSEASGHEVRLGRYVDLSDSYHIYGKRHEHFRENFLKLLHERKFDGDEGRTWTREFAEPIMQEFIPAIRAKVEAQDAKYE